MTITWYGQSCFRIDAREAVLAIDPFSKDIGLTPPRFHANLVLVTHQHGDHANTEAVGGAPQVIAGPGEYEVRGLSIQGIPTFHDNRQGRERGMNTAFRISADGMTVVHLGDFGEDSLREETAEALGDVDVLLVPVGGNYTIDGNTAARIVRQIEPHIAIPMHYRVPGLKPKLEGVEEFLKACAGPSENAAKLILKARDLGATETRIVVLAKS
jgi:L-ascorbate metabolism protein UlaG (beta-lactamase superfamily)